MLIKWKNRFAIDDGVIDNDHKFLISAVNDLSQMISKEAPSEEIIDKLYSLKIYTIFHFNREEALQRASHFPDYEEHRTEHQQLVSNVDQLLSHLENLHEEGLTSDQMKPVYGEVRSFAFHWLMSHILEHDLKMRDYVLHMREEAQKMPAIESMSMSAPAA